MTWIVGGPGLTAPFLAGDICITFTHPDGRRETRDCLCKIYPVARNVLGGFAGSVFLGMRILGTLMEELRRDGFQSSDYLLLPEAAAAWLPGIARQVYSEASDTEQAGGCDLLIVGLHPNQQHAHLPFPRTDAFCFRSPAFEPETTTDVFGGVLGIGSGQEVEVLRTAAMDALQSHGFYGIDDVPFHGQTINKEGDLMIQVFRGGIVGPAAKMARALNRALTTNPMPGVSEWFVYGSASLTDQPVVEAPVYQILRVSGEKSIISPPPFAVGPVQFEQYLKDNGLAATAAVG
jgi:hypothetical protein